VYRTSDLSPKVFLVGQIEGPATSRRATYSLPFCGGLIMHYRKKIWYVFSFSRRLPCWAPGPSEPQRSLQQGQAGTPLPASTPLRASVAESLNAHRHISSRSGASSKFSSCRPGLAVLTAPRHASVAIRIRLADERASSLLFELSTR
jgi:hypothetical protein